MLLEKLPLQCPWSKTLSTFLLHWPTLIWPQAYTGWLPVVTVCGYISMKQVMAEVWRFSTYSFKVFASLHFLPQGQNKISISGTEPILWCVTLNFSSSQKFSERKLKISLYPVFLPLVQNSKLNHLRTTTFTLLSYKLSFSIQPTEIHVWILIQSLTPWPIGHFFFNQNLDINMYSVCPSFYIRNHNFFFLSPKIIKVKCFV